MSSFEAKGHSAVRLLVLLWRSDSLAGVTHLRSCPKRGACRVGVTRVYMKLVAFVLGYTKF